MHPLKRNELIIKIKKYLPICLGIIAVLFVALIIRNHIIHQNRADTSINDPRDALVGKWENGSQSIIFTESGLFATTNNESVGKYLAFGSTIRRTYDTGKKDEITFEIEDDILMLTIDGKTRLFYRDK